MRLNYNFLDHILNLFFYVLIFTFVKSKLSHYFYKYFEIYLFICLFIHSKLGSYSALRRNPNRNNQIIYAKLGDTINITCWFDPKLFNTNGYVNNLNSIQQDKRKRRRSPHLNINQNKNHSRRKSISKSSLSPVVLVNNNNNNHKHHHEKSRHSKKSLDYYSTNENKQDNYFKQSISYNNDNDLQDSNDLNTDIVKYELDWYFLDRQGRMNIISYGNRTSKDTKYKTFILANTNEGSIKTRVIDNTNELIYSSSALYSQSSKSFQSSNNYEFTNNNNDNNDGNRYYTYYLNALIESEDDEGVYQCINPDLPNFILRNVTVLIESMYKLNFFSKFYT